MLENQWAGGVEGPTRWSMKDGSEWGHEALTVCVAVHVFAAAAVLIRALVAMDVLGASLLSLFASFSVFICRIAMVTTGVWPEQSLRRAWGCTAGSI